MPNHHPSILQFFLLSRTEDKIRLKHSWVETWQGDDIPITILGKMDSTWLGEN